MPDLKLDVETAISTIGKEVDSSIESLRRTAQRIVDDLKLVAEVRHDPMKLDIADADAACVIDFHIPYNDARYVTLQLSGGHGGNVELAQALKTGHYRAVILINKLGD